MPATAIPTIKSFIEFVYDNPGTTADGIVGEFNILQSDAKELLNDLDEEGTFYHDGEGKYSIDDHEEELDFILESHTMGGGRKLTEELPVSKGRGKKKAKKKPVAKKKKDTPKPEPKKKAAKKTTKKADATSSDSTEETPKKRVVKPRSSRIIEDAAEAKKLKVDVGTEVKACVDCKITYPKHGGMFRPRHRDPEGHRSDNPESQANVKHVQPRCIDCDKLRSKRKSRFTGLRRAIGVEDIGDPEAIITHPDRKRGGVPDGKFSVAFVDDTVSGFTANLRGAIVCQAEGLIKLRWASGDNPEIVGATKKAIAASKAPKAVTPEPVVAEAPKATKKKAAKKAPEKKPAAKKAPAKKKATAKKKPAAKKKTTKKKATKKTTAKAKAKTKPAAKNEW